MRSWQEPGLRKLSSRNCLDGVQELAQRSSTSPKGHPEAIRIIRTRRELNLRHQHSRRKWVKGDQGSVGKEISDLFPVWHGGTHSK